MTPTDKIIKARARAMLTPQMRRVLTAAGLELEEGQDAFMEMIAALTLAADRASGYWLAPMEATEEMLDAIRQSASVNGYHSRGAPLLYRAMQDAALRDRHTQEKK